MLRERDIVVPIPRKFKTNGVFQPISFLISSYDLKRIRTVRKKVEKKISAQFLQIVFNHQVNW